MQLGDVFAEVVDKKIEERLPVLAVTLDRGVVRRDSLDRKMDREVEQDAYLRALPGDIAYNTMRMWQGGSGLVREAGFISPAYTILRPKGEECSEFWAHAFKAPEMIESFRCFSQGVAKDRLRLYYDQFAAVPALRPPLPEQRKIAAILSSVDETIEKAEAVLERLHLAKLSMMCDMLSDFARGSMTWREMQLGHLARIRRGASPRPISDPRWFSEQGPGWVRISDVTRSRRVLLHTEQKLSQEGCARSVSIRPGDIIMSIAATVGKPIVSAIDACIHDGFVLLDQISPDVDRTFLFYLLQWKSKELASLGQTGTQKNINTSIVAGLRVRLPTLQNQIRIARALSAIDDYTELSEIELEKLAAAQSALRITLIKGDSQVEVDAIAR
ncbi:MAG: restriction endonuclease subunit S [Planctomycetes bacterium]|nr:restriction endonuclease subunit S [Planctomycetota bacterium]